jgi:hypothetical protein
LQSAELMSLKGPGGRISPDSCLWEAQHANHLPQHSRCGTSPVGGFHLGKTHKIPSHFVWKPLVILGNWGIPQFWGLSFLSLKTRSDLIPACSKCTPSPNLRRPVTWRVKFTFALSNSQDL